MFSMSLHISHGIGTQLMLKYLGKSSPWENLKCIRIRSSHSDSPETVELISEWWKECSVGHLNCR